MADTHYVDPKDQYITAEGVSDHSELTTFYVDAKQEDLGPWMHEDERQSKLEKEREKVITGLRSSIIPIGFFIALPVVLGIIIGQIALNGAITEQDPNAMAYVIGMIFAAGITLAITYGVIKWLGNTFHNHAVRALPITFTVLGSLTFLTKNIFQYMDIHIGGLMGYATALASLIIVSIFIAAITIVVWTAPRVPALLKIVVLVLFFGGSVAIHYIV